MVRGGVTDRKGAMCKAVEKKTMLPWPTFHVFLNNLSLLFLEYEPGNAVNLNIHMEPGRCKNLEIRNTPPIIVIIWWIGALRLLFMGCSDVRPRGHCTREFIFVRMIVLPSSGEYKLWRYWNEKKNALSIFCGVAF